MDISIIALMIGVSTLLGAFGLFALLWGLKTRQFEDYRKFLDGTKYDGEDALNDAYKMELKQKEATKKGYRPPD
ncbi:MULTISPECIES: cbb3-type cytochrome oxidase assembly protein CcoS [unclassified Campylobacter]|uniref:cbb3-type cytochrome oxidase assembly protein CcoS n=1 Tax=Campylobacter TaxID=194 RepID=UPI001473C2F9|nr:MULTISPECIES: cbb3-type cytochrome oxidase assembly protein CcoS [unclassified Campylobacter]QKF91685.1 cytochrome oxidase maturation protein, cbb3-type [Campylobacter sp. CCUG 57310]